MTTVLWWHCFSGIAGDMALGSLIDAGADVGQIRNGLNTLGAPGWTLRTESVLRAGVAATRAVVEVAEDEHTASPRPHSEIRRMILAAKLPERVEGRALGAFEALADVEGRLHGVSAADVHFHEVGGVDAIVDIVGTCLGLELLGVDRVEASAVATGTGTIRSAHGRLPNPAPAVVSLLRGAPVYGREMDFELTTPTGAALLASLCEAWGPLPAMVVSGSGFGAGSRDIDGLPNATQAIVGELNAETGDSAVGIDHAQPVTLLEANLDDVTGEVLAYSLAALMNAGAHDAWLTPILMKKGRPGHTLSVLADTALVAQVAEVLAAETGTLGLRATSLTRWARRRRFETASVGGEPVRLKIGPAGAKAEHDDAAAAARKLKRPLREVAKSAEEQTRAE